MANNGGNLTVQYNLRWTEELREKITKEAKRNTRSMNQEIIARLEQSFEEQSSNGDFDKFISFLEVFVQGMPVDKTSEQLVNLINQWKSHKKE
ncbi:Arc family DNA-binding protein [Acinetobacter nectaris]|uniref:Arc family DNA-binding protein n=1 Tax=Acinetobacter nectaris TaxID=1219382 RepID=UPI001F01AC27|nr:Arc family DNA-binding protein [Acinetobacter nectaris]MCF9034198.1 Arc family DNA-binding protein [Acinetobacter nectaris]